MEQTPSIHHQPTWMDGQMMILWSTLPRKPDQEVITHQDRQGCQMERTMMMEGNGLTIT